MKIRTATINDVDNISYLVKSLSHYYLKDKESVLPDWFLSTLTTNAFLERIESTEYLNYIVEENNLIIGYLSMKDKNHLYHLFVSEKHQGKGVARKLWEHATSFCNENLYTLRSSLFAVPIYEKFGFVAVGEAQEKNGIGYLEMELKL